jgi:ADP-ribose pyrophosphatase YjhB (NUDIX family)
MRDFAGMLANRDGGVATGGAVDLGESVAQAAGRETLEESAIHCAIAGIVGIYSDPKHVILYTRNGRLPARGMSQVPCCLF